MGEAVAGVGVADSGTVPPVRDSLIAVQELQAAAVMDSLSTFFRGQRCRINQSLHRAENRVKWARETGTRATKANSYGLLTVDGNSDVTERNGSIDPTSAMGPRKPALAELDGDSNE